jgi:hypothetical protein
MLTGLSAYDKPVSRLTSSAREACGVAEVPTHLADWAVPEEIPTDGFIFQVRLRCTCGNGRFRLLHPGGIQQNPAWGEHVAYPAGATVGGRRFFLVRAACVGCGRDKLLIDVDLHGRLAIVAADPEQVAASRPPLQLWKCVRCGGEEHAAVARYTLHCQEDFDFDVRPKCPDARREDAFVWFGMDTTCCRCGLFTWLWTECEFL